MPSTSRDTHKDDQARLPQTVANQQAKLRTPIPDIIKEVKDLTERVSDGQSFKNEDAIIDAFKKLQDAKLFEPSVKRVYQTERSKPESTYSKNRQEIVEGLGGITEHILINKNRKNRIATSCSATVSFADIHGSFEDIAGLFSSLCDEKGMLPPHIKFLGLGDYLGKDLNEKTVATLLFLFKLTQQYPGQFDLLLGNHEIHEIKNGSNWLNVFSTENRETAQQLFADIFEQMPILAVISPLIVNKLGTLEYSTEMFASHGAPLYFGSNTTPSRSQIECRFHDKKKVKNSPVWNQPCMLNNQEEGTTCRQVGQTNQAGIFVGENTKAGLKNTGFESAVCGHGHNNFNSFDGFFHRICSYGPQQQFGFTASNGSFQRYSKSDLRELKSELFAESFAYEEVIKAHRTTVQPPKRRPKTSSAAIQASLLENSPPKSAAVTPEKKRTETPPSPKRVVSGLLDRYRNKFGSARVSKAVLATEEAFDPKPSAQVLSH